MSHIFIAHVEEDADIALGLALGLEQAGYHTWTYEVDFVVGTSYILQTREAIEQSDAMVVIISPDSLSSSQVINELVRAHESNKKFLPILHGISHADFQKRQPEWRELLGPSASISFNPKEGIAGLVHKVIEGVKALGIKPSGKVNEERIRKIIAAMGETPPPPPPPPPPLP